MSTTGNGKEDNAYIYYCLRKSVINASLLTFLIASCC